MKKFQPFFYFLFLPIFVFEPLFAQQRDLSIAYDHFKVANVSQERNVLSADNYYLMHFKGPKNGLKNVQIARRLKNGYFIIQPSNDLERPSEAKLWKANALWKFSNKVLQTQSVQEELYIIKSNDLPLLVKKLAELHVELWTQRDDFVVVKSNFIELHELVADLDHVTYIGQENLTPKMEAEVLDLNLIPNRINYIRHWIPALNGDGEIISIQEPMYSTDDIDLLEKDIPSDLSAEFVDNHTTQMATIIAGLGNSFITGKGVAPHARLTSSSNADVLPDAVDDYISLGVQVQNHSYGTEIESFYGVLAQAFDQSAYDYPDLLHVFSSGNSGVQSSTDGVYQNIEGYANLTGNFKMAKNVLTVGAVDTTGTEVDFASRGPAYDGRVKPEMVTYSVAGTSNAAALTTGTISLLQQLYDSLYGNNPRADLLKAVLINSAEDVGKSGLDFVTGYGSLNANMAVHCIMDEKFVRGEVEQNSDTTILIEVPANAKNLKITMAYTDLPGNPNDEYALVNDLDLEVLAPNDELVLPQVLNTGASVAELEEEAIQSRDRLNTIEQVLVDEPIAGTYAITVSGFYVEGSQQFGLAYQWDDADSFYFTYPTASDNLPYNGETTSNIRWENGYGDQTRGTLSVQLVNSSNSGWQIIAEDIDLTKEFNRWEAPEEYNGLAILKMMLDDSEYYSDTFTISHTPRISLGFNCGDSLLLQWNAVDNSTNYKVYNLQGNKLRLIDKVNDTLTVIHKNELASNYLSIQPTTADGYSFIQSNTVDYTLLGSNCYLNSFFAELDSSGISLMANLGTVYGIDEIHFERDAGDGYELIARIESVEEPLISQLDMMPDQGLNTYRCIIYLHNGIALASEEVSIQYLDDPAVLVFPNPVMNGGELNVYTKFFENENVHFRLLNMKGEVVVDSFLSGPRSFVSLPNMAEGIYFYSIMGASDRIAGEGKILVRRK